MSTSTQNNSPLYGLVLSGGHSSRMGQDKGLLNYHGMSQRQYTYQLLQQYCDRVFLSLRSGQEKELKAELEYILDIPLTRGPLNGILTALKQYPEAAFMVLACDLPLITSSTLARLKAERDPQKIATAYTASDSDFPEPLLAIWEPGSYESALAFIQEHDKICPRKFLFNADIKRIKPLDDEELYNANRPEDYEYIQAKLHHGEPL